MIEEDIKYATGKIANQVGLIMLRLENNKDKIDAELAKEIIKDLSAISRSKEIISFFLQLQDKIRENK
jgi:hypothetical protein